MKSSRTCHVISCHVISCHVLSCPVMTGRVMSVKLCHDMPCHVMSVHVMSCHVMTCLVMSCHDMSCQVMSCHVMSCHVMPCHFMSCQAIHQARAIPNPRRPALPAWRWPGRICAPRCLALLCIDTLDLPCFALLPHHHHRSNIPRLFNLTLPTRPSSTSVGFVKDIACVWMCSVCI
jgi:hypothetical protein